MEKSNLQIKEELLRITHCLNSANLDYALCGGLAVAVHGYPRATKDIDLLVSADQLDRVREVLASIEYDLESGEIPFDKGSHKERRIFRVSRAVGHELFTLDLILVTPVFADVWETREDIELESQRIHVVSIEGLIKMKQLASRPQDLADIDALSKLSPPKL